MPTPQLPADVEWKIRVGLAAHEPYPVIAERAGCSVATVQRRATGVKNKPKPPPVGKVRRFKVPRRCPQCRGLVRFFAAGAKVCLRCTTLAVVDLGAIGRLPETTEPEPRNREHRTRVALVRLRRESVNHTKNHISYCDDFGFVADSHY
jgi:hypothetical protein